MIIPSGTHKATADALDAAGSRRYENQDHHATACFAPHPPQIGVPMVCANRIAIAQPKPGTVLSRLGRSCPRAARGSYPLSAFCSGCHEAIVCADGQAGWVHSATRRIQCPTFSVEVTRKPETWSAVKGGRVLAGVLTRAEAERLLEQRRVDSIAPSGDLAGWTITCSCGLVWSTSLSFEAAQIEGHDHLAWHAA